jgi:hypothetical protein
MRTWILIFASSFSVLFVGFAGCTSENTASPSSAASTSGGGYMPTPCNGGEPDGFCNALGNQVETCECVDCTDSAVCTGTCADDGQCTEPAEDCTCNDCYMKVAGCPPRNVGCDDDGECNSDEDCVCTDCTNTPRCTDNCLNNGSCVQYLEGCSCADCASVMECGGNGPASSAANSSSAAAGTGGTGGMPASSSSMSAVSSSSAAGGMGGMGAAGGAGGTGG